MIPLVLLYAFFIGTMIWDCVDQKSATVAFTFVDCVEYPATLLFFLAFIFVKNKKYAGIDFMITAVLAAIGLIVVNAIFGVAYWLTYSITFHQISIIALTLYQFFLGLYLFRTEPDYI